MNPNYLLKDELQYELFVLGPNSDSDFQTLRKLFRSVVAEKVPVDLYNLNTESVEELYECVVNKTLELQALITQQKSELALLTPRFRTRLSHLRGRLLQLTELDPSAFTPHFYYRLPHPLSHLLKEILVVDGTNGNPLCDF